MAQAPAQSQAPAPAQSQAQSISFNGTTYAVGDLSESARTQVGNLMMVDAEISRLQRQMAIAQTARNAYAGAFAATIGTRSEPVSP